MRISRNIKEQMTTALIIFITITGLYTMIISRIIINKLENIEKNEINQLHNVDKLTENPIDYITKEGIQLQNLLNINHNQEFNINYLLTLVNSSCYEKYKNYFNVGEENELDYCFMDYNNHNFLELIYSKKRDYDIITKMLSTFVRTKYFLEQIYLNPTFLNKSSQNYTIKTFQYYNFIWYNKQGNDIKSLFKNEVMVVNTVNDTVEFIENYRIKNLRNDLQNKKIINTEINTYVNYLQNNNTQFQQFLNNTHFEHTLLKSFKQLMHNLLKNDEIIYY